MNGSAVGFKELSDSDYTRMRRNLLRSKGSERQREFLEIVRDRAAFLNHFADVPTIGAIDTDFVRDPMTESEFKDPPSDTEQTLYKSWRMVTPSVACRSTFWAYVTLKHIRMKRIDSVYLAANGGNFLGGAERIDFALRDETAEGPQRIDSCVRTVLRRLGGLPEVRGNRSVYVDCPFARAWWRERLVEQTTCADPESADQVRKIIRLNQTYWEKLIDRIVSRNSTFGSTNIRNAFFKALAQFVQSNPDSALTHAKGLQRLCRRATTYQGHRELSILTDEELDDLMKVVVRTA